VMAVMAKTLMAGIAARCCKTGDQTTRNHERTAIMAVLLIFFMGNPVRCG
jgi:hypothetical protein